MVDVDPEFVSPLDFSRMARLLMEGWHARVCGEQFAAGGPFEPEYELIRVLADSLTHTANLARLVVEYRRERGITADVVAARPLAEALTAHYGRVNPCPCGNPSVGRAITGEMICAPCRSAVERDVQEFEETA